MNRKARHLFCNPALRACAAAVALLILFGCPPGNNATQEEGTLLPGELALKDGALSGVQDGNYTVGDVTIAFQGGAGSSLVADRETLVDWATQAGLVQGDQGTSKTRRVAGLHGPKWGARAQFIGALDMFGGVQTLLPNDKRFVEDWYGNGTLSATLLELGFDPAAASVHASIQFELVPDDGSATRTANVTLTWAGLTIAGHKLSVTGARLDWVTPEGVAGSAALDPGTVMCMLNDGRLAAVEQTWMFRTVLGASENAKWMGDATLAYYAAEFNDQGAGVAIYGQNEDWDGTLDPLFYLDPVTDLQSIRQTEPQAIVQIPVGGSARVCAEDNCEVGVTDMEITDQADGLAGRIEATYAYSEGWFGTRTDRMQRTIFEFAGGLIRLLSSSIIPEYALGQGSPLDSLPAMPDAQKYEMVFSRLDLHSQVLLDTNEELDGAGDQQAAISLISGRINDIPIRIDGDHYLTIAFGDHVTLTTHCDAELTPGTQYYWVGMGTSTGAQAQTSDAEDWHPLPKGTVVTGATLDFTVPDSWRPSTSSSGSTSTPLSYMLLVFAFDNSENLVGMDAVELTIN